MRPIARLLPLVFAIACSTQTPPAAPSSQPQPLPQPTTTPIRVLMLTATAGFRHDSIPTARQVMTTLASQSGAFTVSATENLADVTTERLAMTDVLMFALTSGELAFDAN